MIGDVVNAVLPMMRADAESLMVDTCVVRRLVGVTTDPETAAEVETWVDIYTGPAKSQTYEAHEANPDAGGHEFTTQRYAAHFPVGAFTPQVGDVIEWTACRHDPALVGTRDRITSLLNKAWATAMRCGVDRGVA